jgi:IS4 transposase
MEKGAKPLTLRLVRIKVGRTKMWMLTSILDKRELSVKTITRFYKMRWGIEVQFRGLKQTWKKRHLRCRNSDNALIELEWALLGMVAVELLALREQFSQVAKVDPNYTPKARSLSKVSVSA